MHTTGSPQTLTDYLTRAMIPANCGFLLLGAQLFLQSPLDSWSHREPKEAFRAQVNSDGEPLRSHSVEDG